jgi:hypothetical protein
MLIVTYVSVTYKHFLLGVIMLSVVILSVVAPSGAPSPPGILPVNIRTSLKGLRGTNDITY